MIKTPDNKTKRYYYMPIGNHVLTEKQIEEIARDICKIIVS